MTDIDEISYDVVIVGSGFSGSTVAYQLALLAAKSGKKLRIGIVEAGPGAPASREQYMESFYLNNFKSPTAPYPPSDNARDPEHTNTPRPTVQDLVFGENDQARNYLQFTKGSLPFASSYERLYGGTSNHWVGTALRMSEDDFQLRSRYGIGRDWPIKYAEMEKVYGTAEYLMGVSADVDEQRKVGFQFPSSYKYPMPRIPFSLSDEKLKDLVDTVRLTEEEYDPDIAPGGRPYVTSTPAARNSRSYQGRRSCHGNTNCTPICPIQAKYDTSVALENAINLGGVEIVSKTVVNWVEIDPTDGLVRALHCLQYNSTAVPADNDGSINRIVITGKIVVLAANAIENAKILLNSEIENRMPVANSSGQVGRNLMDHPTYLAWGLSREPLFQYRGPLSTAGIENLRTGPFRSKRAGWRIEIGNEGWNWSAGDPWTTARDFIIGANNGGANGTRMICSGASYIKAVNSVFSRQFHISFLVEQDAEERNRVELSKLVDGLGIRRPLISYSISDYTAHGFKMAAEAAKNFMSGVNAEDFTAFHRSWTTFSYRSETYNYSGAGHLCGTHIMGDNKSNSVVDEFQRSWDHKNLFLVGGGSMPSVGTQNPTLTIVALSLRTAQYIYNEIGKTL